VFVFFLFRLIRDSFALPSTRTSDTRSTLRPLSGCTSTGGGTRSRLTSSPSPTELTRACWIVSFLNLFYLKLQSEDFYQTLVNLRSDLIEFIVNIFWGLDMVLKLGLFVRMVQFILNNVENSLIQNLVIFCIYWLIIILFSDNKNQSILIT
jgi:hypothetical protein